MHCSSSIISASTNAVTASTITGALKATHRSCLPFIEKFSVVPVSQFKLFCSLGVEEVGLTAKRNTNWLPLVIPPTTPPA